MSRGNHYLILNIDPMCRMKKLQSNCKRNTYMYLFNVAMNRSIFISIAQKKINVALVC